MFELDATLRLVIAFAIVVVGSGIILPSYIIAMRNNRINRKLSKLEA